MSLHDPESNLDSPRAFRAACVTQPPLVPRRALPRDYLLGVTVGLAGIAVGAAIAALLLLVLHLLQ